MNRLLKIEMCFHLRRIGGYTRKLGEWIGFVLHGAVPVSTERFQALVARRGACWPRKKYAKRRLPIRSTHSQPN